MINFAEKYNREEILEFLGSNFLKDFEKDIRSVEIPDKKFIKKAYSLGYSSDLELSIFEFEHTGSTEKRVALTKEAFDVLRDSGNFRAIAIFYSSDSDDWRFSLMTATPGVNEKGKITTVLSNPKRYSFFLGPKAKVNTPTRFLITKGQVQSLEDLKERFSIEVVNKEFYKEISKLFVELVGGTLGNGTHKQEYKALLKLPGIKDTSQTAQEFAVRLIGRLIFCWFLREKRDNSDESLMPKSLISHDASKSLKDYYHDVLEPIFFKVLNVPINSRKDDKYAKEPYSQIPYLNGGLFSPHDDDFYSTNETKQEKNRQEVLVPDMWIQKLFEVLETYNFTIDENSAFDEELSIDPEMLGRIFENLLAEINPETGESARKSTGSYYTPRVIVDYMVDESLYLYLKNKTGIDEEKLRSLLSYDLDDDTTTPLTEAEKEKVVTVIDELKILDPACGSGAFPMGALQKIVFVLQQLDPLGQYWFKAQIKNVPIELRKNLEREHQEKNFDYIRKLGVIRRNIFGVDIQPIATEISRLRCFLTLIVDQEVDDMKENRGIDPLPNLDFKFVTANSLISLPEKENPEGTMGMFEDSDRINELKDIRDQFFNASNFERVELKDQFRKIQLEMSRYYNSVKSAGADLTEMLLSWDPFSHKMTKWFDSEWMFGIKNGFDVVIGNPPYYQLQKDGGKLANIYKDRGYQTFSRTGDLYCLFYERGNELLENSGFLAYITSNKWMRSGYGENLRVYLSENTTPIILIDLGSGVFDNATVDTNILILKKGFSSPNTLACTLYEDFSKKKDILLKNYVNENGVVIDKYSKDNWLILPPIELSIKSKIERYGTPLRDWNIKINYGIKTGFNEAFIIDEKMRKELIAQDSKSAEIIRPILRGRDIKRYKYTFADKWLLTTFPSKSYNIDDFPAVRDYLLTFGKEKLEQSGRKDLLGIKGNNARKKTTNKWFETQDNIAYWNDFSKPKIVWAETMRIHRENTESFPRFSYIAEPFLTDKTCFIAVGEDLKYLLAFLNSTMGRYQSSQLVSMMDNGGYLMQKMYVEQIRVCASDERIKKQISSLVDLCIGPASEESYLDLEGQIDTMIFDLFGITYSEREYLKRTLSRPLGVR